MPAAVYRAAPSSTPHRPCRSRSVVYCSLKRKNGRGPIHTGRDFGNLRTNPLMLLGIVDTPMGFICLHLRMHVLCRWGESELVLFKALPCFLRGIVFSALSCNLWLVLLLINRHLLSTGNLRSAHSATVRMTVDPSYRSVSCRLLRRKTGRGRIL